MSFPRVLIIAYWFPPAGGVAVQRALSLARYLPQHNCEVHVLAPPNPPGSVMDPALVGKIPSNVSVHRAWTPMPSGKLRKRFWGLISRKRTATFGSQKTGSGGVSRISNLVQLLLSPDPEVVWAPFAIRRARRVVKQFSIDTILVTAPPFSAFLIGNRLKKEFPHLRLISDFRDEWLRFFLSTFEFQKSPQIRRRAEAIERATIDSSDAVVSVTSSLVEELRSRYNDQPAAKFVCIPNGYDPAAFLDFHPRMHAGEKIVVTYAGTVYKTTSPRSYFEALDRLPEALRSRIETHFIGRVAEDQKYILESRTDVAILGYVPQSEALSRMEATDFLLLTMTDPTATTGKIYEYLATGKPILALSPLEGEVARTLEETGGGWCVDPGNPQAIQSYLQDMVSGKLMARFHPNWEAIRRYERPRLAGEFAAVIRGPADKPPISSAS
jgi:glycosyltransferase involved in cell wall biosynthesis